MDQQEDQRRTNRHVTRAQRNIHRRNMIVQRRNVVHYRVQNISGNVTITNNYFFDVNVAPSFPNPNPNPGVPFPPVLPSPQPVIVYGPNQNEAFGANAQVAYVAVPPITYIPPQATHIAIPLTHAPPVQMPHGFPPSAQILNGAAPRNGNFIAPQFVHVGPPGMMNGAPGGIVRFLSPREEAIAPIRVASPTASYVVTPNGNFVTGPTTINVPTFATLPSRIETVTYTYSNTTQRVVPPPIQIPNGARIIAVDVPPVEEVRALSITEVVTSTVAEEFQ